MTRPDRDSVDTVWRRLLRGGSLRPMVLLLLTIAGGLVLAGIGVGVAWLVGIRRPNPGYGLPTVGDVRGDDVALGLAIAGVVWLLASGGLWIRAIRRGRAARLAGSDREWVAPWLLTAGAAAGFTVLTYVIYRRPWDDTGIAVIALALLGTGATLLGWLPTAFRHEHGRPGATGGGTLRVRCADCGYAMNGLRRTTCPECGREYTIDELILAQRYGEVDRAS